LKFLCGSETFPKKISFLSLLVKVLAFFGLFRLGPLVLELCFDSTLLFANGGMVVPFGSEIRRRILGEVFGVLDEVKRSQDSHLSQHKIISYSFLLAYLL
jgi:hypothetical protein